MTRLTDQQLNNRQTAITCLYTTTAITAGFYLATATTIPLWPLAAGYLTATAVYVYQWRIAIEQARRATAHHEQALALIDEPEATAHMQYSTEWQIR